MMVRPVYSECRHRRDFCETVITNPMDLQTMLKKVKLKQYKSKREFKDDLDLIWSNCFTYNATEVSPPAVVILKFWPFTGRNYVLRIPDSPYFLLFVPRIGHS